MKVLLAYDGSSYSKMATLMLKALQLPAKTEVVVFSVVPEHIFLGGLNFHMFMGEAPSKKRAREEQQNMVTEMLAEPLKSLRANGIKAESMVRWGNTAEIILKAAKEISACLIVIGAKGVTDPPAFRLGSVAQKVMRHANTNVLLVREEAKVINRVLLATDGSKHSETAGEFLIDMPLPKRSQVVVITALQSHSIAMLSMPALDIETNQKILDELKKAEEKHGQEIVAALSDSFRKKGYKTISEVIRGGASESILMAADKHKPEVIALGARGLTGMESFLLGSVTERVARYARQSVLICRSKGNRR